MKYGKKILLSALIIPVFFLLTGVIVSVIYEDTVIKILKKYLDKHLTTEIEVSRIDFSVFKKFPNATVEFRNIVAKSGVNFSAGDFSYNTDTLLTAKSVFFEFSLPLIIKGDYKLKNILLTNGKINLLIDRNGKRNFDVWESEKSGNQDTINFSLQNIILINTEIKYTDLSNTISLNTDTRRLQIKADFSEKLSHVGVTGDLNVGVLEIGKSYKLPSSQLKVDFGMDISKNAFKFYESTISAGKLNVKFNGDIKRYKANTVLLSFKCNRANINELINFFPGQLKNFRNDYMLTGLVDLNGTIKGTLSKNHNPLANINFNLSNGSLTNRQNRKKVSGIYFKGDFTNGVKRTAASSLLNINDFSASHDKSNFNGALKINGFDLSDIEVAIKSKIDAGEFFKFLNIDTLEQVSGTITSDIFLKGRLSSFKPFKKEEIVTLYKEGTVVLNDFAFKFTGSGLVFSRANGTIILGDIIKLEGFSFQIFQNDFKVDGNLSNLPGFLFYKDILYAEANIESKHFDLKSLIAKGGTESSDKALEFPRRLYFKSNFKAGSFVYGKFSAENISGYVTYKPKEFNFEKFNLGTVEGLVSGSATVTQNPSNHIHVTCFSKLSDLNIQKLFVSMNNFGQNVILENNLKGKISGSLDFSARWDEKLKIVDSSVLANSDFEIKDGELVKYDPMLGLSKYIDVDELREIKFNTLKNQIYIKDKIITIPEMDIHSSAFSIKGMGIHRFDNSYEYRIQVELSELLARKAKKRRKEIEAFGTVQDDGLGKLNLPIKITGRGSLYEVNLDRKRAMDGFRKSLSQEKEELENIFNIEKSEEIINNEGYNPGNELIIEWDDGNEKKDFIFENNEKKDTRQPQFIIEWDDGADTEKNDTSINEPVN